MSRLLPSLSLGFRAIAFLAMALCFVSSGRLLAQTKAQNKAKQAVDKAAEADVKFKEAEALREAYVVLAGANHDYDGHRVKSMGHIRSAVKILDQAVAKNGSAKSKALSAFEDAVAASAKRATKQLPTVHELQAVSDAQLKKVAVTLAELRPTMVQLKQKNVLAHIDDALKELNIALKIR